MVVLRRDCSGAQTVATMVAYFALAEIVDG